MNIRQPMIPANLLREFVQLVPSGALDQARGGQYTPTPPARVPFQGALLPVSNEDLRYAPEGTYTAHSHKLYTNGHGLSVGAQVLDPMDGATHTVRQELTHGPMHPLRRYLVERKGGSSPR